MIYHAPLRKDLVIFLVETFLYFPCPFRTFFAPTLPKFSKEFLLKINLQIKSSIFDFVLFNLFSFSNVFPLMQKSQLRICQCKFLMRLDNINYFFTITVNVQCEIPGKTFETYAI